MAVYVCGGGGGFIRLCVGVGGWSLVLVVGRWCWWSWWWRCPSGCGGLVVVVVVITLGGSAFVWSSFGRCWWWLCVRCMMFYKVL